MQIYLAHDKKTLICIEFRHYFIDKSPYFLVPCKENFAVFIYDM